MTRWSEDQGWRVKNRERYSLCNSYVDACSSEISREQDIVGPLAVCFQSCQVLWSRHLHNFRHFFQKETPKFSTTRWTTSSETSMSHWLEVEVEDADLGSLKTGKLWQSQQRRCKVFIHFWMSFSAPSASDSFLFSIFVRHLCSSFLSWS